MSLRERAFMDRLDRVRGGFVGARGDGGGWDGGNRPRETTPTESEMEDEMNGMDGVDGVDGVEGIEPSESSGLVEGESD